jgi:hypothetical protein
MDPIAWAQADDANPAGRDPVDPLQRIVQVSLAIYLMPVVAIVCAIGGASIALSAVGKLATRLTAQGHRPSWPGPHATASTAGSKARQASGRRRVRVGG